MEDEEEYLLTFDDDSLFDDVATPRRQMPKSCDPARYRATTCTDDDIPAEHIDIGAIFTRSKTGPNLALQAIERLYFLRRYADALSGAERWLEMNGKLGRPLSGPEIHDIAARCCVKLNRPEDALKFLRMCEGRNADGILFLEARLCGDVGDHERALSMFAEYLNHRRPNDYMAWVEIARILMSMGSKEQSWARSFIEKSLRRIERSQREETEFSRLHAANEIARIQELLAECSRSESRPSDTGASHLAAGLSQKTRDWIETELFRVDADNNNDDDATQSALEL